MVASLGNTLGTARRVSVTERSRAFRGTVVSQDKFEFYRLNLSRRSRFDLTLTNLRANADVAVLNNRGRAIAQSRRRGSRSEAIASVLDAGFYYVRVALRGRGSTRFKLALSAQLIPPTSRSNTAPSLVNNAGLSLSQRVTALIDRNRLRATDGEQSSPPRDSPKSPLIKPWE